MNGSATMTGHQHTHGHTHGASPDADWRWLAAATALIVAFMAGEVVAGLVAMTGRPRSGRPIGFCATYAMSLLFCLPVFVFASPYAAVGGMTIAQSEETCVVGGMPRTAITKGYANKIVPLDRMAAYLINQYGGQHGEKTDSSEKSEKPDKS